MYIYTRLFFPPLSNLHSPSSTFFLILSSSLLDRSSSHTQPWLLNKLIVLGKTL